jgi:hypothetical protein
MEGSGRDLIDDRSSVPEFAWKKRGTTKTSFRTAGHRAGAFRIAAGGPVTRPLRSVKRSLHLFG